jgi:putative tricarboxylic transport membrane protein
MVTIERQEKTGAAHSAAPRARVPWGPRVVGIVVLAGGLILLWDAIKAARDYGITASGPWLPPLVVASGWVALALIYLIRQIVAPRADYAPEQPSVAASTLAAPAAPATLASSATSATSEESAAVSTAAIGDEVRDPDEQPIAAGERTNWLAPAALVAALIGYGTVLEVAGFVVASAIFFVVSAQLLSRPNRTVREVIRTTIRNVIVGVALSVSVYLLFTRLLDINLPSGVLYL